MKSLYTESDDMSLVLLPQGLSEFEALIDSLFSENKLPTDNRDSIRLAVAIQLSRIEVTDTHISKTYLVNCIKAGAARQVAFSVLEDLEQKKKQKQAEATANIAAEASSGPKQQ